MIMVHKRILYAMFNIMETNNHVVLHLYIIDQNRLQC